MGRLLLLPLTLLVLTSHSPSAESKAKLCAEFSEYAAVLCDGKVDCIDGSDESAATCHSKFNCTKTGRLKCPGSSAQRVTCVAPSRLCDGKASCPGGWDESSDTCKKIDCTKTGRVACPPYAGQGSIRCIQAAQMCNNIRECPNGLDENRAVCNRTKCKDTGRITCPSGSGCLKGDWLLCNGRTDCADGSDEGKAFCKKTRTCSKAKCPGRNQCLESKTDICNGKYNCLDGSDEKGCPDVDCEHRRQCPGNSTKCLGRGWYCDGIPSGPNVCNGLDEDPKFCAAWPCTEDYFKIPGTNLCEPGVLCDGTADTERKNKKGFPLDEDPAFCSNYTCPDGGFKCKNGVECVWRTSPCDGTPQCTDKSDEDPKFCATYKCASSGRPSCPSGGAA